MTVNKNCLIAYNFIAPILGWNNVNSLNEITLNGRVPKKAVEVYSVETHQLLGELYMVMGASYWIKVSAGGEAKELYFKNHPDYPNYFGVAVDLSTLKPIEYYKKTKKTMKKYDFDTDKLLQTNYFVSKFEDLPETYKKKLNEFEHKDKIFFYANKPYGKVVEISV